MSAITLHQNTDTFLLGGNQPGAPLLNLTKQLNRIGDSMETQNMNILLIAPQEEDYIMMRQLLAEIAGLTPFTGWVYYLEWAGQYDTAKNMIEHNRYDIYLLDATFQHETAEPSMAVAGPSLLQQIKTEVPIILLVDQPESLTFTQIEAADILVKSQLNRPLLERTLHYALERKTRARLEKAQDTLKRWFTNRNSYLTKINQKLRDEMEVRQHAEQDLRESEERYRTLVGNIQDGVVMVQEAKVEFANEAFARMIGYQVKDIIGMKFLSLIAPDDLELIASRYGHLQVKPGVPKEYEFHLLHRDQSTKVMVNINVGAFTYRGKTASIATVKDITVRKFTEEQLRKLSRVVHQSPISIMITDTNGNIEYVNPMFTQTTGYALKEIIGENPRILKSGEHPTEYYEQLWATIASGGTWRGELQNRKKTGQLYWEFATISPISNKSGRATHYLAILEDITERKRVLAELRRHRHHLQELVDERTAELTQVNEKLQQEVEERSRMAEMNRQGRERLRLQYNGIPVPTYTWQRVGRDFVLIDYNDVAAKAPGKIIDFMGKKASEMFADKPDILEDFKQCFLTKKTLRRDAPYQLLTTQEKRHFITSYIFVPPNVVMVHMEDVTHYKETERQLQECRAQLEKLTAARMTEVVSANEKLQVQIDDWREKEQESADTQQIEFKLTDGLVGTWDWNVDTGEMVFSAEWAEMLGYTPEEVKQNIRSWAGLMHLNDIAKVMDNLNSHFAGEIPFYESEHRLKTKSGQWKWILGQGKVVDRDKNGRVLRMTGVHRDISARKMAEEALRRSNAWFQSLIETISDWVWEIDKDMVYTYVSPKVLDILGYTEAEVIGKTMFDFMDPDEGKHFKAVLTRRMVSRKPLIALDNNHRHKNGDLVVLETNGMPFYDEDGLYCGYRGAHQDISGRNNAKGERERAK